MAARADSRDCAAFVSRRVLLLVVEDLFQMRRIAAIGLVLLTIFSILCMTSCHMNVNFTESEPVSQTDDENWQDATWAQAIVFILVFFGIPIAVVILIVVLIIKSVRKTAVEMKRVYAEEKYKYEASKKPTEKAVKCEGCGAGVEVTEGTVSKCPFCNSPVS